VIAERGAPFPVHDLACSRNSGRVWLTSASGGDVALVGGADHRVVHLAPATREVALSSPAGSPP
jgi:hypothetical protein